MMYRYVLAATALVAASFVSAQVEVIDRKIPSANQQAAPATAAPSAQSIAEMYYQMQVLQQEVLQLRGIVEQQAFELKKLKQQRLDHYLDLDRRIGALGQGGISGQAGTTSPTSSTSTKPVSTEAAINQSADEMQDYRDALNLVLKQQKYDEAIVAFQSHLEGYPQGRFAANAQYWLGEVFLLQGKFEEARQWFTRLLSEYPEHPKVPDAQYKLGTVYHQMGDLSTAKSLLDEVSRSDSNASRLAKDYLNTHFSQ